MPEIKITGIEEDVEIESLTTRIVEPNQLNCNKEDLTVKTTWKGRQGTTAIVQINNKKAYNTLTHKTHLNLSWTRCQFYDNAFIPRCLKCSTYGHLEKHCRSVTPRCPTCDGEHHHKNCASDQQKCWVCEKENLEKKTNLGTAHPMSAWDCPIYSARLENEVNRTLPQLP